MEQWGSCDDPGTRRGSACARLAQFQNRRSDAEDVTEHGQAMPSSVEEAQRRLAEAERALDDLRAELADRDRLVWLGTISAMLAHEVRNALTPIMSLCSLANRPGADRADLERAVGVSAASAERTVAAMEAVLELGRGSTSSAGAECDAAEVLRAFGCRSPRLDFVRIVDDRELRIRMGASALECVLTNLVTNSERAVGGQRGVWLAARREGQTVVVEVGDRGPGFEAGVLSAVGEGRGVRGPGRRMGLGLLISQKLVESAGGTMMLGSAVGGGGVVRIELPMQS